MDSALFKKFFIIALSFALFALYMPRLSADEDAVDEKEPIDFVVGDIKTVPANGLTRVSVTNPDIADISDAKSDKISLVAKRAGLTVMFLWDADGEHSFKLRVAPEDMDALKDRVQKVLDEAKITGLSMEVNLDIGKVVLTGELSKDDKNRLTDAIGPYSDNLVNFVREEKIEDLVQVDMQIVEISTSLEKNLGILWGNSANASTSVSGNGGGSSTAASTSNTGTIGLNYNETIPSSNGSVADFFKIGKFYRTSPLEATVNALLQEGKARLISKPRLVVVSGKQASFLVGGEIPVESTTTSASGGTTTSNTTYTQYGVNLTVTPTIREGKIDVILNVDIRDIDASNSSNGNTAFITRTATTDLRMDNKQTIALAGFIKYTDSKQLTEVPFLSKIPVLGALFRDTSTPAADTNTEMVIILTPSVLTEKKFSHDQLVIPTPEERSSYREIAAKYEVEPIPSHWQPTGSGAATVASGDTSEILPAMMEYARMVQAKISRVIFYPQTAVGNDITGTVKLKLHILKNGSLDSEEVAESSGNAMLDQYAMQAAMQAAPYDAFITGMDQEDLVFTIPIVYNRMMSQEQAPAEKVIASY